MGRTKRARKKRKIVRSDGDEKSDGDKNYAELLEWMRIAGNGWQPPENLRLHVFSVPVVDDDDGNANNGETQTSCFQLRGLQTTQPIAPGQALIDVPLSLVVTHDVALQHLQNKNSILNRNSLLQLSSHQILALFLIGEKAKGQGSDWIKYLNTLPDSYDVPCYCDAEEIRIFPPFLRAKVGAQVDLLKAKYVECKRVVAAAFDGLDFGLFKWAWFTVNSRGVYYPDGSDNLALVPFLDMFNHSPGVAVSAGRRQQQGQNKGRHQVYNITNLNISYQENDQVMINYGAHGNLTLYLEYGFVLPENQDDFFPLSIPDLTAVFEEKRNLIEEGLKLIEDHSLATSLRVEQDGSVSWNVGACLHILQSVAIMTSSEPPLTSLMTTVFECEDFFSQKSAIKQMCALLLDGKLIEVKKSLENFDFVRQRKNKCSSSFSVAENLLQLHVQTLQRASKRFNDN